METERRDGGTERGDRDDLKIEDFCMNSYHKFSHEENEGVERERERERLW